MITFTYLLVTGLGVIYTMCAGFVIILTFKIFLPEEYPERGISVKKVFDWAFNFAVIGTALVLSAYVGTHLPLP